MIVLFEITLKQLVIVTRYGRRKEYIKLILGLSKAINKNLSLFILPNLSKSYLNEIEKVKNIPKQIKLFF
jgi:hypothetical protein